MSYHRLKCVLLVGLVMALAVIGGGKQASALAINPGFDYLQTLPGGAVLDLGPFVPGIIGSSVVEFQGLPVGPGMTDTIIQRHTGLPAGGLGVIDAEIIELSLRSVDPIVIDHGGGGVAHDVFVQLTPVSLIGPGDHDNTGTVTITSHHEVPDPPNAGFFDSSFDLNATFTLVAAGHTDPAMIVNTEVLASNNAPFSHIAPPDYPNPGDAGNFFPGAIVHEGPHPVTFPAVVEGQPRPDDLLPPLCDPDFPEGYMTSVIEDAHARWAEDPNQMVIDLQPGARHCPVEITAVVAIGADQVETFDSTLRGQVVLQGPNFPPDMPPIPLDLSGPVKTKVRERAERMVGTFDTEILSMDLSGRIPNPLGGEPMLVQVRQDPDRPSLGRTIVTDIKGVEVPTPDIPVLEIPYCSDQPTVFPNNVILKEHCHEVLAVLESTQTAEGRFEVLDTRLSGMVVDPTGQEVAVEFQGQMQTFAHGLGVEGARLGTFDVEIVSMDLRGPGLFPGGPPTIVRAGREAGLPSPGETTVTQLASGEFHVDSFFDVFVEISVDDGESFVPAFKPTHMELGGSHAKAGHQENFNVDSFFDVFTELSVDRGPWMPMLGDEPTRMTLGGERRPGDTDDDRDTDNTDLGRSFGNFSGPQPDPPTQKDIVNKYPQDGDNDGDRDVDNSDLGASFGAYTGPGGAKAGHTTDHSDHADLIYDLVTGDVTLDATEAAGGVITNFVLKNASGGADFNAPGTVVFPWGGLFLTDLAVEISATDGTATGFSGQHDLGNIFPTGFDLTGLEAFLTQASYVGSLGTGNPDLDLIVIPEPGTLCLLGIAALGLLGCLWRRKRGT